MEYSGLILSFVIGGLYRRAKGGWCNINSTVLRIVGFLIPLTICFLLSFSIVLSISISSFVTFGWLMPKHGYGIGMGSNKDHTLLACIAAMLAQYGLLTILAGIVWEYIMPHSGGLYYAQMGCIIWLGYFIPSRMKIKSLIEYPKGNWFIDGYTCYGELILGAVLVGGIPLANIIAV